MLVQVTVGCKLGQMTRVSKFMLDTGLAQNVESVGGSKSYGVGGDYVHLDQSCWEALESLRKSEGVTEIKVQG